MTIPEDWNMAKRALGKPVTWQPTNGYERVELRRLANLFSEHRRAWR